jgi:hypothetical protein
LRDVEKPGNDKSVDANSRFKDAVQKEVVFAAVGNFSEEIAADCQSGHECGQNRGYGVRCIAENLGEHSGPYDLINQTSRPGKKETKKTDPKEPILFGALNIFRHIVHANDLRKYNSSTDSKPHHNCKGPGQALVPRASTPWSQSLDWIAPLVLQSND